ncbi:MAG TPA: hypothetical protein VEC57_21075 [Candidatus Limnocylindrales bacterium]|nr:hypothetical protein [Candidatus Limnocylindrales bacterium]
MTPDPQDAVTLAQELRMDPELEAAIAITNVELNAAQAEFERVRGIVKLDEYLRVWRRLEDLKRQAGVR